MASRLIFSVLLAGLSGSSLALDTNSIALPMNIFTLDGTKAVSAFQPAGNRLLAEYSPSVTGPWRPMAFYDSTPESQWVFCGYLPSSGFVRARLEGTNAATKKVVDSPR